MKRDSIPNATLLPEKVTFDPRVTKPIAARILGRKANTSLFETFSSVISSKLLLKVFSNMKSYRVNEGAKGRNLTQELCLLRIEVNDRKRTPEKFANLK